MLSDLDLPGVSGDEDAPALAATVWLADKRSGFPLTTAGMKVPVATCGQAGSEGPRVPRAPLPSRPCSSWSPQSQTTPLPSPGVQGQSSRVQREPSWRLPSAGSHSLGREAPGAGEDVVLPGVDFLHALQVPGQQVFAADFRHAREVVDFLKRSQ